MLLSVCSLIDGDDGTDDDDDDDDDDVIKMVNIAEVTKVSLRLLNGSYDLLILLIIKDGLV